MKRILLKGTMLTGLLLAATACGDGYSNLSPSGSHSRKSGDSVTESGNSSNDSAPSRGGGSSGGTGPGSGPELVRGSNAWFAHESVEHALRLAVVSSADVATSVSSTSSVIQGQTSTVEISLASGAKLFYTCNMFDSSSRSGTVLKKDVSCSVAS